MTTKEKILSQLNKKNQAVSGEDLAARCGVSRAAIWKAVNALRKEGCNIQGTTNGGYVLHGTADIFSKEVFVKHLKSAFPQFSKSHVECFKEIDSTNTYAKHLLSQCSSLQTETGELTKEGKKFNSAIFVAEHQTAGRGRSGRTFVSPDKTGIYLSIVTVPKGGVKNPAKLTAFSAVGVCRAIKKLYGVQPSIKWINDIFLNGKKISGILTEGSTNFETGMIESAIIGIGLNIEPSADFLKAGISKIAGSILKDGVQNTVSRAQLAAYVAGEVLTALTQDAQSVIKEYKSLSFIIGKTVEVHSLAGSDQGIYKAVAKDITDDAALVVECEDKTLKTLSSGEVTLKSDAFV